APSARAVVAPRPRVLLTPGAGPERYRSVRIPRCSFRSPRKPIPSQVMFKDILRGSTKVGQQEERMPYRPEHRDKTRARIIQSAQALFNRRGFTGVSIDDVMKHAGLTRGGFYSYFRAKSELYAEAVTPWSHWAGADGDLAAREVAQQLIDAYLSREHFDDVEGSCPMVTLASDVARSGQVVKRAFERVFVGMTKVFDEALRREGRPSG